MKLEAINIDPKYNRAGALERVEYDGTDYVTNIAYNAKGQRLLIAFGNGIMTRYTYDPVTMRLRRQRSEKFTKTTQGLTTTYAPNSGNRQDDAFDYDLVGNILNIISQRTDCGIAGTTDGADKLNRQFTYDPLYRLKTATGRESDTQNQNDYLYADAPAPGTPNADNVRAYTRKYQYDKLGNVLQMKQIGDNAFTRDFGDYNGNNLLNQVKTGNGSLIQDFQYDAVGNQKKAGANRYYEWTAGNALFTYKNQASEANPTIFAQYQYDSAGNRVSKMVRTGTDIAPIYEWTVYIDGIFEFHELDNGTVYEKNYVHIMDSLSASGANKSRIAMVRIGDAFPSHDDIPADITDATVYILENQIGSSVARLDTSGNVIDREEYYPFGDSSLRTFTKKRYRYVGKEKDLESGLYYYGARYYAAWTCRFISIDPLAADYPFYTPYNYAGNKPINRIDIDGMQEGPDTTSLIGDSGAKPSPNSKAANIDPSQSMAHTAEGFGYADSWGGNGSEAISIDTNATASSQSQFESGPRLGEVYPMRSVGDDGKDRIVLVLQNEVKRYENGQISTHGGPVVGGFDLPENSSYSIENGVVTIEMTVSFIDESPVIDLNKTDTEQLGQNLSGILEALASNPNMNIVLEGTIGEGNPWPQDPANPSEREQEIMREVRNNTDYYNKYHHVDSPTNAGSGDSQSLERARAQTIKNIMIEKGAASERVSTSSNMDPSRKPSRSVFLNISFR